MKIMDISMIPAERGTMIIYTNENDTRVAASPAEMDVVLAWRMETVDLGDGDGLQTYVLPITINDSLRSEEYAIVRPDGLVDDCYGRTHLGAEGYLAACKERYGFAREQAA